MWGINQMPETRTQGGYDRRPTKETCMPINPYDHNARYDDVMTGFLAESRRNLIAAHACIEHCLAQLSEE